MRTSTAQMHTDFINRKHQGFTLTEAMIALVIVSLMVLITTMNLKGLYRKNSFKGQVQDFISTMQTAARAASQSNRRYEVIIDLTEQTYTLREITTSNLSDIFEDEIIKEANFSERCQLVYVLFDDLVETDEDYQMAIFRAGHSGWQNGGKIVFVDEDERPYTIIVNRINGTVTFHEGEIDILMPKRKNEVPF